MQYVEVCQEPGGSECEWVAYSYLLPPLDVADASLIATAVVSLWALAWAIGQVYRSIFHKSR